MTRAQRMERAEEQWKALQRAKDAAPHGHVQKAQARLEDATVAALAAENAVLRGRNGLSSNDGKTRG